MTIIQQTTIQRFEHGTVWVQLAATTGWDVRTARGLAGELIAHFDDWHRLERTLARLGHPEFTVNTDLSAA